MPNLPNGCFSRRGSHGTQKRSRHLTYAEVEAKRAVPRVRALRDAIKDALRHDALWELVDKRLLVCVQTRTAADRIAA